MPSTRVVIATGATIAADGDVILCNTAAGGFTLTLPNASAGARVLIKKISTDSNTVTISGANSESVLPAAAQSIATSQDSLDFVSSGTAWHGFGSLATIEGGLLTQSSAAATYATIGSVAHVAGLKATAVKTGAYTAVANDLVLCDTTGGTFAVAAPASPADGDSFGVKWYAGTVSGPTITGAGLSGGAIPLAGETLLYIYDTALTKWIIQAGYKSKSSLDALYAAISGVIRFIQLPERAVSDGVTNGTTTVTSATAAFSAPDVGRTVVGDGIPTGATVSSVTNATTIVISSAATTTSTNVKLTIVSGAYALRSTVTSDATQYVIWRGSLAPTIGSGYMQTGVDSWDSTA